MTIIERIDHPSMGFSMLVKHHLCDPVDDISDSNRELRDERIPLEESNAEDAVIGKDEAPP